MNAEPHDHRASRNARPEFADDFALVERVRAGDDAVFEILMRRHNERVFRTARAVLGRDHDAEEAAQDAWVKAWRHLGDFAGRSSFSTWLLRITVREAIVRLRRRARVLVFPLVAASGSGTCPAGADEPIDQHAASPPDTASSAELRRTIERAVDRLPASLRTAFVLRAVEGLDTHEAAAVLGIGESALKVRLHRARSALRRELEQRIGNELGSVFGFAGERCDRMVAAVMARLRQQQR